VNNPIAEANGGITVPPSNPAALAKAMIEMAHLPEDQRVTMGSAARRHVEQNYDFERLSGKLAEALDRSLDGR
jgi:glycosyltransferase involved in cell wall biosynthesis